MRFAADTGGTFTDLIVEDNSGRLFMFKSATTPDDPIRGVLDVLQVAADGLGVTRREMLAPGELFIHGTTRAINAIVTGSVAKTALLTTKGNPDVLVIREGGRIEPFNFTVPFPDPYIPRHLTFEVPERVRSDGSVDRPLDEGAVLDIIEELKKQQVEAVAVSLLWSITNAAHENRVAELLRQHLPGVPFTLSHEVNPIIREYRRTSASAIDASLKPLMTSYMDSLEERLREAGFGGRVLVVTSQGGVLDAHEVAQSPIHAINSGPVMAPVAGRYFVDNDTGSKNAIVADTGGTTYDVSLIRNGAMPWTKETWIGQPFRGHMTGFPSVDVKSVGAGGGSIAWVDAGGLLHVGPDSAGAVPGPVCYGAGGTKPTVTDAALVLGYLDPANFLGGAIRLDVDAAANAILQDVGQPLGRDLKSAAAAIIDVMTENMVQAIDDITVAQGIDPSTAVLVGGGGAAGLNSVLIARRLRCETVVIPEVGAALSAAGGLISDLSANYQAVAATSSDNFDFDAVNSALKELRAKAESFLAQTAKGAVSGRIEFKFEGHYPSQVWDIDVPIDIDQVSSDEDVQYLVDLFHKTHNEMFAVADHGSPVEIVGWQAQVFATLREGDLGRVQDNAETVRSSGTRKCYFPEIGEVDTRVLHFGHMDIEQTVSGPAIVESPFTTVVVNPEAIARRTRSGSLVIKAISE